MSESRPKRKTPRTAFKKGQSGNPGGRPKTVHEVRELARKYTKDAIKTLVSIMRDPNEKSTARVRAAEAILDRGHGRPQQQVDMNVSTDLVSLLVGLADGKAPRADSDLEERSGAVRH